MGAEIVALVALAFAFGWGAERLYHRRLRTRRARAEAIAQALVARLRDNPSDRSDLDN